MYITKNQKQEIIKYQKWKWQVNLKQENLLKGMYRENNMTFHWKKILNAQKIQIFSQTSNQQGMWTVDYII